MLQLVQSSPARPQAAFQAASKPAESRLQPGLAAPQRGSAASCKRPAFSQIDARSRVPWRSETFWRYVGQDGILRQVGNLPLSGTGQFIGRPIANRPQDAILPYIAGLEPQRAGRAKSSRRAKKQEDSNTNGQRRATKFSRFPSIPEDRSSCARLDKLKHVLPTGAEMSLWTPEVLELR